MRNRDIEARAIGYFLENAKARRFFLSFCLINYLRIIRRSLSEIDRSITWNVLSFYSASASHLVLQVISLFSENVAGQTRILIRRARYARKTRPDTARAPLFFANEAPGYLSFGNGVSGFFEIRSWDERGSYTKEILPGSIRRIRIAKDVKARKCITEDNRIDRNHVIQAITKRIGHKDD